MAWTSAWTAGGWRRPASTTERPRWAARSAATALAARVSSGESTGAPGTTPSWAATARAKDATSVPLIRKRWSAFAPVSDMAGSAT